MLILQLSWAPLSSPPPPPPLGFLAKVQRCLRSHRGLSLGKSAVARQLPDTSESWSATEDGARERDRKRGWDEFFWGLFKPSHPVKVTAKRNIQTHLSHIFNAALLCIEVELFQVISNSQRPCSDVAAGICLNILLACKRLRSCFASDRLIPPFLCLNKRAPQEKTPKSGRTENVNVPSPSF